MEAPGFLVRSSGLGGSPSEHVPEGCPSKVATDAYLHVGYWGRGAGLSYSTIHFLSWKIVTSRCSRNPAYRSCGNVEARFQSDHGRTGGRQAAAWPKACNVPLHQKHHEGGC